MKKERDTKEQLFEMMNKVNSTFKTPLNENIHNNIYDGGILNTSKSQAGYTGHISDNNPTNEPKPNSGAEFDIGHKIYKEVKALMDKQLDYYQNMSYSNMDASQTVDLYVKILDGVKDAVYQDMGDSINPNAGAAPDERV